MTREIPLTRGFVTLVDDELFDWLNQWRWLFRPRSDGKGGYAVRYEKQNGRDVKFRMHRIIMDAQPHEQVDHRNQESLDNQRHNLRMCSTAQNTYNQGSRGGTSIYKGVYRKHASWYAEINAYGKKQRLGRFSSEIDAARAYDDAARELHGSYARLNFPIGTERCALRNEKVDVCSVDQF